MKREHHEGDGGGHGSDRVQPSPSVKQRGRRGCPQQLFRNRAILAKLHNVTRTSNGWSATCPAHDDRTPSLSVRVTEDRRVLVKCFASCTAEQVVAAVGMRMAELMPATNIVATYDYRDEHGILLSQAVRLSPKSFRLRRQNAKGEWVGKMDAPGGLQAGAALGRRSARSAVRRPEAMTLGRR